jgi:hypothetical protein
VSDWNDASKQRVVSLVLDRCCHLISCSLIQLYVLFVARSRVPISRVPCCSQGLAFLGALGFGVGRAGKVLVTVTVGGPTSVTTCCTVSVTG